MIFLTGTKCKIRFIYVGFNQFQRKKSGVKNVWKLCPLREGRGSDAFILNFHFDYWNPSLRSTGNTFRSSLNFGFFITGPSSLFADSTSPSELFRGILSWKWSIPLSPLYCVRRCRNGRMPEYRGSLTPRAHYVKLNSSSKMRQPCTLVMRLQ